MARATLRGRLTSTTEFALVRFHDVGAAARAFTGTAEGFAGGQASESDPAPRIFTAQLRSYVPGSGSAIAMIAEKHDVDEMLTALPGRGEVVRRTLTPTQAGALKAPAGIHPAGVPRALSARLRGCWGVPAGATLSAAVMTGLSTRFEPRRR